MVAHLSNSPIRVKVAVAIITNAKQQILITRRAMQGPHGGLWEFPGGKLEEGELPTAALVREIKEEVGLDVVAYDYLGEIHHEYAHRAVSLLVYDVQHFQGEPACCEAQLDMRWVALSDLKNFEFPAANLDVIELIQQKIR